MKLKQKIYLNISLFALVALLFVVFGYVPIIKQITNIVSAIQYSRNLPDLEIMQKQKNSLNIELESIKGRLVDKKNALKFIQKLESIAEQTNNTMSLSLAQQHKKVTSDKHKEKNLLMQIKLTGNKENLINFLEQLEQMKYFLDTNSIDIHFIPAIYQKENQTSQEDQETQNNVQNIVIEPSYWQTNLQIKIYTPDILSN